MDIKDIRRLYDMKAILGMQRKNQIVCPLPQHSHHDYTPSFSVYWSKKNNCQLFKCHGACGLEGDVIDLTGYTKVNGYNPKNREHTRMAISLLTGGFKISPPVQPKNTGLLTNDMVSRYKIGEEVSSYAKTRGLEPATIERFKIGQFNTPSTSWMTIPTFTGERLTMMKMRNLNSVGKKDRFTNLPGGMNGIFNINEVKEKGGKVLIVKAEIPSMLLSQRGFLSCAPNAGEGALDESWYRNFVFCEKRIVVGDNDPDSKIREKMNEFAVKRAEALKAGLKFPPENYKDIDEFMLAEPNAASELIKGWLA